MRRDLADGFYVNSSCRNQVRFRKKELIAIGFDDRALVSANEFADRVMRKGLDLEALIDLFWSKYSDLRQAIDEDDVSLAEGLDREIDPLILAIFSSQVTDSAGIQAQFRFALDLLNEEAEDRGCVRRNVHILQMLVDRYITSGTGAAARRQSPEPSEPSIIADATIDGFLDEALLNRLSDRIMVISPNYRVVYSNDTNSRCLDLSREQVIGRHLAEIVGIHRFRNEFKAGLEQCLEGQNISLAYADQADGQTVVMHCRMSPCLSGPSRIVGVLLVMQETADRRRPAA